MTELMDAASFPDDRIEWFHQNLELLLEDIKLGDRIEIYFDAEDLVAVILGMYYFRIRKTRGVGAHLFDWEAFRNDDRVLVHCLAYAGWLGEIKLLPPHQAEFLNLLEHDFHLANVTEKPWDLANRLLQEGLDQGQLTAGTETISLDQLERLKGPELVAAVGDKVELAKEIFKLLQCIKGTWRSRFLAWQEQGTFQDSDSFDPIPYLQDEIFLKVRNALESGRKHLSINNFSDALAVTILAGRTRDFKRGVAGAKLPLFFNHPGKLKDAIEKAGVQRDLEYRVSKNKTFSVLRDWHYFYFRATFGSGSLSKDQLQELLVQTERLRKGKAQARNEALSAIGDAADIKVDEQIKHMQEFRFFETWLASSEDVQWVIQSLKKAKLLHEQLREAVEDLQSPEVKNKFSEASITVSETYQMSAGTYGRTIKLFSWIEARIKRTHRWKKGNASPSDMMLVLGLFRFPFPEEVYSQIEETLGELVGDEASRMRAHSNVVEALYRASSGKPSSSTDLPFVFGLLWAAELDSEIAELAEQRRDWARAAQTTERHSESPWFLLVWASALLRQSEDKRHPNKQQSELQERQVDLILKGLGLLGEILETQKSLAGESIWARIAVGVAYLDFHFFLALRSPKLSASPPSELQARSSSLLANAVDQAEQAWKAKDLDERLRIYALNQLLYYLAHGVLESVWTFGHVEKQLKDAANQLLTFESHPSWHYRYDDSLARYYEAVGQAKDDRGAWEEGKKRIDRALETCFGDPLVAGTKNSRSSTSGGMDSEGYHQIFHRHYKKWEDEHPSPSLP
jgi:hypothetical protein